ncbi:hypothetical protein MBLNU13_g10749t1 [Cladosporium sp. NU13]
MASITRPISWFNWFYNEFGLASIQATGRNAYLIITARTMRMISFGGTQVMLALFFAELKFTDFQIGLFMTLTLLGDVFLGIFLTMVADRVGRRRILFAGSGLMVLSGLLFSYFESFWILLLAAIVGVVSTTGGDFGPFRVIEESILSELTTPETRSDVLAWYVTISTWGLSVGGEIAGRIIEYLQESRGWSLTNAYHSIFVGYAVMGVVNSALAYFLTAECEADVASDTYAQVSQNESDDIELDEQEPSTQRSHKAFDPPAAPSNRLLSWMGSWFANISTPTLRIVYKLWLLLMADSFADGMVPFALCNLWLERQFNPSTATLGDVTAISYLLAAISSVFAGPLARRIGLINTMVFTHVPSSAAVFLFGLPSHLWMSIVLLFIRAGLNNMDQAPRAAFIAAVVKPEERTAVMGITATLRTIAAMIGPSITGLLAAGDRFWIAFLVAGGLRLAYDFGLYALFVNMKLYQHETVAPSENPESRRRSSENEMEDGEHVSRAG